MNIRYPIYEGVYRILTIVLDSHRLYGTASHTIEEHCQGVHPAIRPASRSQQCHRGVLL